MTALSAELDRRFEAVVFAWESVDVGGRAHRARVRELVEALCSLGLDLAVVAEGGADDVDRVLGARPGGPGELHLLARGGSEVFRLDARGAAPVERLGGDGQDRGLAGARWLFARLWARGISASQVAIAGLRWGRGVQAAVPEAAGATAVALRRDGASVPRDAARGGGPPSLVELLDDQLRRRRERAVPSVGREPGWHLVVDGVDPELERVHEALMTLSDGRMGTRASPVVPHPAAMPEVLLAGVYTADEPAGSLLEAPRWTTLPWQLEDDRGIRRIFDLRTGVLRQEVATRSGRVEAVLFSSLARPGTAALRAEGPQAAVHPDRLPLVVPPGTSGKVSAGREGVSVELAGRAGGVAASAVEDVSDTPGATLNIERLAAYRGDPHRPPGVAGSWAAARAARAAGFERLLLEHRRAWAARWEDADVAIEGDEELQLAVRFALHHLIASAAGDGEAAVGARGLSGPAYRGHVFWDADVYVLPFLAATHPPSARAVLEYRVRRLPAAREAAAARGLRGARFPWESAASGRDVTPRETIDRTGARVPILTGEEEEHIVADVAWAAGCYLDWTGDREFEAGAGSELLAETARYFSSRIRRDAAGRGHLEGVIGPDEYHVGVSDNAFTNVMARWNLRRAAAAPGVEEGEAAEWLAVAASLHDGLDPETGLYEQFAGFFDLEDLVIAELVASRPVAADVLLGTERVQAAQVLKQADALMIHHLLPEEAPPGSLEANLDYYEPRTAHGSSLSPGVHASLLARAGRLGEAVELVRLVGRIDLGDLTGTTAGGLHLAAMGSLWQAFVWGFLGVRPAGGRLAVDPVLPAAWRALEARVVFRGARVRLRAEPGVLHAWARPGVELAVGTARRALAVGETGVRIPLR